MKRDNPTRCNRRTVRYDHTFGRTKVYGPREMRIEKQNLAYEIPMYEKIPQEDLEGFFVARFATASFRRKCDAIS